MSDSNEFPTGTRLRIEGCFGGSGHAVVEGEVTKYGYVVGWDPVERRSLGATVTVISKPRPQEPTKQYAVVGGKFAGDNREFRFVRIGSLWQIRSEINHINYGWTTWSKIIDPHIHFEGIDES